MKSAKYVIIGNSIAAVGCIEGIRRHDKENAIIVVSNEKYHVYGRPLISYFLMGKTDEEKMKYRPDSFYADNGCELLLGETAVNIDAAAKTVELAADSALPDRKIKYEKLLIAAGASPFVPEMNGLTDIPRRFSFMTLDDAKALDQEISEDKRVLIIGAGLIGMKCAEGIAERCKSVTLVEMAPRCLPAVLDEESARIIQKQMEAHNCVFKLETSVSRFVPFNGKDAENSPCGGIAELKNGESVPFDILVTAVGVRPNAQLASAAGAAVNKGIVIDDECRTSLPDVFAAGDCVECRDLSSGSVRVLAILPNAYRQGETAGIIMAGGTASFAESLPMNAAGFFGLHVVTAGTYAGEMQKVVLNDFSDENDVSRANAAQQNTPAAYRKFFIQDGLLKGFILIGETERAGIYTALVRNKTPLASIDFNLIKEKPQLMAFGRDSRADMLAKTH